MLSVGASMESMRIGGLFDYLLVVGLPFNPHDEEEEGSIVFRYPPEPKPLPFEIIPFTTPRALKRKKVSLSLPFF
jgi:hypothetical protein